LRSAICASFIASIEMAPAVSLLSPYLIAAFRKFQGEPQF